MIIHRKRKRRIANKLFQLWEDGWDDGRWAIEITSRHMAYQLGWHRGWTAYLNQEDYGRTLQWLLDQDVTPEEVRSSDSHKDTSV